jgi:hypothetical protein
MLFFGYFSCLIMAFTAVAMFVIGSYTNTTTLSKQHHPRPPIEQTITPEQIAPLHLEVTREKEARKRRTFLPSSITNAECSPVSVTNYEARSTGHSGYFN